MRRGSNTEMCFNGLFIMRPCFSFDLERPKLGWVQKLIRSFLPFAIVYVATVKSHSYLTAKLRWHLSNMNVISNWQAIFHSSTIPYGVLEWRLKLRHGKNGLVTAIPLVLKCFVWPRREPWYLNTATWRVHVPHIVASRCWTNTRDPWNIRLRLWPNMIFDFSLFALITNFPQVNPMPINILLAISPKDYGDLNS